MFRLGGQREPKSLRCTAIIFTLRLHEKSGIHDVPLIGFAFDRGLEVFRRGVDIRFLYVSDRGPAEFFNEPDVPFGVYALGCRCRTEKACDGFETFLVCFGRERPVADLRVIFPVERCLKVFQSGFGRNRRCCRLT